MPTPRSGKTKKRDDILPEQVEMLAAKFWTGREIAAYFDCDEATIRRHFAANLVKGRNSGKGKLRDAQLKAALNGNVAMLIWMGKQYLDQSDRVEESNTLTELFKEKIKIYDSDNNVDMKRFLN